MTDRRPVDHSRARTSVRSSDGSPRLARRRVLSGFAGGVALPFVTGASQATVETLGETGDPGSDSSRAWSYDDFERPIEYVVPSEGIVYTVTTDVLVALDGATGDRLWEMEIEGLSTDFHAREGRAYVFDSDEFVAREPDGTVRWRTEPGTRSSFSIGGNKAYIDADRELIALSLDDGSELWRVDLPEYRIGRVRRDVVQVQIEDGGSPAVLGFDGSDGTRLYRTELAFDPSQIHGGVDFAYYGGDGRVVAISIADGTREWTRQFDGEAPTVLELDGTLFALRDDVVRRLSLTDGSKQWTVDFDSHVWPTAFGQSGIVFASQSRIVEIGAEGTRNWSVSIDNEDHRDWFTATTVEDTVYSTSGESLIAVRDGEPVASYESNAGPLKLAVGGQDRLFAAAPLKLYGFDPGEGDATNPVFGDPDASETDSDVPTTARTDDTTESAVGGDPETGQSDETLTTAEGGSSGLPGFGPLATGAAFVVAAIRALSGRGGSSE